MTREQIIERLGEVLQESSTSARVDWSSVTEKTEIDALGFDSLTILDLIFDIEEAFGLEVPAEDILSVKTVGSLASYLEKRQDEQEKP
jgi:acyl carrier protein